MTESLIRFVVGGMVVSLFAILSDTLKPKSFAGLFGAAPSVALATLALTVTKKGVVYAAIEAHSMVVGALAFSIYAATVSKLLMTAKWPALPTTAAALSVWFGCGFGVWYVALR